MGRKPASDVAREKLVAVRLTDAEFERFTAAANRDGEPLSVWFRQLAERRDKLTSKKRGK